MNLHYIGSNDYLTKYKCNSSIEELCSWYRTLKEVQHDTETNVCGSIVERELKVLQFGDTLAPHKYPQDVYVVQWSFLSEPEREQIRDLLRDKSIKKIIQNSSFDYQVWLNEGVVMDNIWDTMVMEKCLFAGYDYDLRFFSLAESLLRRYHIDVSKEQQSNFGDDIINDEKLEYAATDVIHLGRWKQDQRNELIKEDLLQLAEGEWNENEAVLAFADIEYYGMGFNPEKWRENIAKAQPIVDAATVELNSILLQEPYFTKAKKLICKSKLISPDGKERTVEVPCILPEDKITINWNSPAQVIKVLQYIFPEIEKASALELKKYLSENDPKAKGIKPTSKEFIAYLETLENDAFSLIKLVLLKKTDILEKAVCMNFRNNLVQDKYLLPKGTVNINWNSNLTKLEIFRWFNPKIDNTDADTVEDNIHLQFFQFYKQYNNANSLLTKYGESFITKHVDSDGRVRTRFDTVLSTGRVSSSSPKQYWAA
jgi:hypothetical protein